jgi:methionyl-tRNA formyltransferase
MKYIIACSKLWNPQITQELEKKTKAQFHLIQAKEELRLDFLKAFKPDKIFFPHWSFILPAEIYKNYECVMFHMTDLPFGRGGSPLQNLIVRGLEKTVISAFRCADGVDTGDVYLKKPLSLDGKAQQIFETAAKTIETMIVDIIQKNPIPKKQTGEVVEFKRRKPDEGHLELAKDLKQVYDFIRMLDADGYPHAFLQLKNLKIDFSQAQFDGKEIVAQVRIYEEKK